MGPNKINYAEEGKKGSFQGVEIEGEISFATKAPPGYSKEGWIKIKPEDRPPIWLCTRNIWPGVKYGGQIAGWDVKVPTWLPKWDEIGFTLKNKKGRGSRVKLSPLCCEVRGLS